MLLKGFTYLLAYKHDLLAVIINYELIL